MLGFPQKEKLLETCGQTGVFSDQILRLRPLNDTDCSALFILFIAIRAKPVFTLCHGGGNRHESL